MIFPNQANMLFHELFIILKFYSVTIWNSFAQIMKNEPATWSETMDKRALVFTT